MKILKINNQIASIILLSLLLISCNKNETNQITENSVKEEKPINIVPDYKTVKYETEFISQLDKIVQFEEPCENKGTVVSLDYETPAYAINKILNVNKTINKSVEIYLPYNYDPNNKYDILYLLHGTGGNEKYWLDGRKSGPLTRNVLDNMIDQGLCKPIIVVTPNFYSEIKDPEFKISDDKVKEYALEVEDNYLSVRNDIWVEFFKFELRNNIIPLVETTYSTFANGITSKEGLESSRDHRAISGLSRGSMATMRAGFIDNLDIFSYFGNFSGIWYDFDKFKKHIVNDSQMNNLVNYWYNGNGTEDFSAENHINFTNNVMKSLSETFIDGKNFALIVKPNAEHSFENWIVDLYNSLLVFFK